MKEHKPTSMKDLLPRSIEQLAAKTGGLIYEEDIKEAWERSAGKEASRHSAPTQMRRGVLFVSVDSPVWIYQLNLKKDEIEKKLNALLKQKGPVTIKLRAGEG